MTRGLGLAVVGLTSLAPRNAWAAPKVKLVINLARTRVIVGQQAMVEVTVTTTDGSSPTSPSFAAQEGLHVQAVSNSFSGGFSTSFGTGATAIRKKSRSYKFIVWADAAGEYEISPQVSSAGGVVQAIDIPTLEVLAGRPAAAMPGTAAPAAAPAGIPEGARVGQPFVVTELSPSEIWLGESFRYSAEAWKPAQRGARGFVVQLDKKAGLPGAVKQTLAARKPRRETVQGVAYDVELLVHTLVTPQRAGEIVVPGPSGQAQLVERVFFDTRALAEAISIHGEERKVNVKPLPAAGQPKNFKPFNVGRLKIRTKVDRKKVPTGEGFTLEVTISGEGNLALIEPDPWPKLPEGLRRYDPEVGDAQRSFKGGKARGTRTWKFLMIPDGGGKVVIPAHTLHYFDPRTGTYEVAKSKKIKLKVAGDPAAVGTKTGQAEVSSGSWSEKAGDEDAPLAPIRGGERLSRVGLAASSQNLLRPKVWSWLAAGVPLAFGASWLAGQVWSRFGPDESARARSSAKKWRASTLAEAVRAAQDGETFWAKLSELLQRAAIERVGPDAQGLTRGALGTRLVKLGVSESDVKTWTRLLDRGDAARFGAGAEDEAARMAALGHVRDILASKDWSPR